MPPKRMSDILASSSIDARISSPLPTATTDTSDGPTLPITSAANEVCGEEHGTTKGTKRKRTTSSNEPAKWKKAAVEERKGLRKETTNHPSLYEPWVLLPSKRSRDVEGRTQNVQVVVWSKNQNVKSGISRLLRVVGAAPAMPDEGLEEREDRGAQEAVQDIDDEGKMVVVSAQGEGTVKIVGIVDMVRRIVAEGSKDSGNEEGLKWYIYTVLSSVEVARTRKTLGETQGQEQGNEDVNDEGAEAMDVDEEGGAVKETQRSEKEEMKNVPVLSVWISRKRMTGWKEAFGEQEMLVHKTLG